MQTTDALPGLPVRPLDVGGFRAGRRPFQDNTEMRYQGQGRHPHREDDQSAGEAVHIRGCNGPVARRMQVCHEGLLNTAGAVQGD